MGVNMQVEEQRNVERPLVVRETKTETPPRQGARRSWIIAVVAFLIVVAVVIAGILPRVKARATLRAETNQLAVPAVVVVQPKRSAPGQEVILPANVQAFKDAPIYARTNGYLKRWYVDIGAHVKAGQVLAQIDAPELDQQLRQAQADVANAEANRNIANITAERWRGLRETDSVSQQDADEKVNLEATSAAQLQA